MTKNLVVWVRFVFADQANSLSDHVEGAAGIHQLDLSSWHAFHIVICSQSTYLDEILLSMSPVFIEVINFEGNTDASTVDDSV